MSVLNLLLGTRRLRREIEAAAIELGRDIEHERLVRAQLRHTFVERVTSPLGLLSTVAAGFVAGKMGGSSSNSKHVSVPGLASAAAVGLAAARAVGMQVALPMVMAWIQSKLVSQKVSEAVADAQLQEPANAHPGDSKPRSTD